MQKDPGDGQEMGDIYVFQHVSIRVSKNFTITFVPRNVVVPG